MSAGAEMEIVVQGDTIPVIEQDTSQNLDIGQATIEPFGLSALLDIQSDTNAAVPLVIRGKALQENGRVVEGSAVLRATTQFNYLPKPHVLVPGGWVPLALSPVHNFLIDRNILSLLEQLHAGRSNARLERIEWWCQHLDRPSVLLNPLPIAWEGDKGQIPSFSDIRHALDNARATLAGIFPKARTVPFDQNTYEAINTEIQATRVRQEKESEFLQEVCPKYLANTVARGQRRSIFDEILALAIDKDLQPFSIVMLCVFSSHYRSSEKAKYSIGHALLKPKQNYSEMMAHNALSDLRHFEVAALATGLFIDPPALITDDTALTALWSTLRPHGYVQGSSLGMQLDIDPALFVDLDSRDAENLALILQKYSRQ
ncbi:hypothetical protein [Pseudohalioglobus lutimaris]|nr:hypothetical protein [Pseudohalioglobus lutimaris]